MKTSFENIPRDLAALAALALPPPTPSALPPHLNGQQRFSIGSDNHPALFWQLQNPPRIGATPNQLPIAEKQSPQNLDAKIVKTPEPAPASTFQIMAGIASALAISLPRFFAYIPNVLKGVISHSRVGWGIFATNGLLHSIAMFAAGENFAALNGVGFFVSASIVSLLCWSKGTTKTMPIEKICMAGSLLGLSFYGLFKAGAFAGGVGTEAVQLTCALLATAVSLLGSGSQLSRYLAPPSLSQMTSEKASRRQIQMAMLPWSCSILSSTFALLATNSYKLATLVQPCSLMCMSVVMCMGAAYDVKKRASGGIT